MEKLEYAYKLLNNALNNDGDFQELCEIYEDAIVEVMEILRQVTK